jgi:hypothetical protein
MSGAEKAPRKHRESIDMKNKKQPVRVHGLFFVLFARREILGGTAQVFRRELCGVAL